MESDPLPATLIEAGFLFISTSGTPAILLLLMLVLLLIGSALVSASEVAYFSLSPSDIENLEKEEQASSKRILRLKESPRELLATVLISNNFINIAIVIVSEVMLRKVIPDGTFSRWATVLQTSKAFEWIALDSLSVALSFIVTVAAVTFLLVLFGEVAPKIYANLNNIKHARFMSQPLILLRRLLFPLSQLLLKWSGGIEERVYRKRLYTNSSTDKKELDKAIELTVTDQRDKEEVDILKGIIKFGDVETRQVMKSRVDVVGLDIKESFATVISVIKESGFSRIPIFEEDFDTIVGIFYVKDLLGLTQEGDEFAWQELIRDNVLYVPETKKIDELLKEFQLKRTHIAIVVDEYGGSAGIVTLEDVMEEVVGEIRDEFDLEDELDYVKIDDHNYIFEGKTLLNDVIRILNLENDVFDEGRGTADSVAGLILELESKIPKAEKIISYKHLKFKIVKVSKRRIEKVKITL